ncbi:hypothetical protein AVEN_15796-1 [Araneus ventricosus]|uniref:Uncharacterized protein n=1 Tax=Araneus ventricosus TaxID=182803 RepID=A0A4Y2WL79_ARAVE|nr:hypothetical protein AVEN_15796-1 [Araneus ventricosus]
MMSVRCMKKPSAEGYMLVQFQVSVVHVNLKVTSVPGNVTICSPSQKKIQLETLLHDRHAPPAGRADPVRVADHRPPPAQDGGLSPRGPRVQGGGHQDRAAARALRVREQRRMARHPVRLQRAPPHLRHLLGVRNSQCENQAPQRFPIGRNEHLQRRGKKLLLLNTQPTFI